MDEHAFLMQEEYCDYLNLQALDSLVHTICTNGNKRIAEEAREYQKKLQALLKEVRKPVR